MGKRISGRALALALLALVAGCGDLPRPFAGNPGATARRLSQPPPARLAVEAPGGALLTDKAAAVLTTAVALGLAQREVPAVTDPPQKGDWRLVVGASAQGGTVVPQFTVLDPLGEKKGNIDGKPVDAATWSQGNPRDMALIGTQSAGPVAALLTRIEAARRRSDPTSLVNRAIRVMVKPVTGAPGDGNTALARQMRRELPKFGMEVQDTPADADFIVTGTVHTSPIAGKQTRVEIVWSVFDAAGHDLGRVAQLNQVPAGTLGGFWADIAVVVAQEAAGGVNDVILNGIGEGKTRPKAGSGGK